MKNLPPFYIGQKVEYITGRKMPKGTICTVYDTRREPCGCWFIQITEKPSYASRSINGAWECVECRQIYKGEITEIHNWSAKSFRAIEEQKFPLISYSRVLEKEKVSAN